jgi:hypothetical protein
MVAVQDIAPIDYSYNTTSLLGFSIVRLLIEASMGLLEQRY